MVDLGSRLGLAPAAPLTSPSLSILLTCPPAEPQASPDPPEPGDGGCWFLRVILGVLSAAATKVLFSHIAQSRSWIPPKCILEMVTSPPSLLMAILGFLALICGPAKASIRSPPHAHTPAFHGNKVTKTSQVQASFEPPLLPGSSLPSILA